MRKPCSCALCKWLVEVAGPGQFYRFADICEHRAVARVLLHHRQCATTRYAIALDGGGELAVMQQNAGDGGPFASIGEAVRLTWPRHLNQPLAEGA